MPALWVLAVVALLLVLILSTPVRIYGRVKDHALTVDVGARLLRVRLYPPPERKARPEKPKPKKKKKAPAPKKKGGASDLRRVIALIRRFWAPALDAFGRVGKGVRVDPCRIRATFGGRDEPADAAILCGDTLAATWAVMPTLERLFRIPSPYIVIDVDFDAPALELEAELGVTVRVWTLLAASGPLLAEFARGANGVKS